MFCALAAGPRTYADAVDGARAALRVARDAGRLRLKITLPVLPPSCAVDDLLRGGDGANAWPGGGAQSHREGLQPLVMPLLQGYDPSFLGMIDVGMGVWSLAGGKVTAVSNVADLSFDTFAKLCDGEFGAAPTRADHTLLLINPRLTSSRAIGQPWQRDLRRKARALVDDGGWLWAYRCRTVGRTMTGASQGVVVSSELADLRGSRVFAADGKCVATSDDPDEFSTDLAEARRAILGG